MSLSKSEEHNNDNNASTISDTALLLSTLGANVVDREQFDNSLVNLIEQQLLQGQNQDEIDEREDGQISDDNNTNDPVQLLRDQEYISTNSRGLRNNDSTATSESVAGLNNNLESSASSHAEETEHDKRVRRGEVTPFGSGIEETEIQTTSKKDTFLHFNKYMQDQIDLQQRKKLTTTGARKEKSGGLSKKSHAKTRKDPLNLSVLFPKKRKQKQKLGLGVSENPRDARKLPGKSLAETTSTYLNSSDDSDYLPSDQEDSENSDDKGNKSKTFTKVARSTGRKLKPVKRSLKDKSSDEDFSDYDSDYRRPTKRLKKETDDGDLRYYQTRVQHWKEQETRLTGEFQKFDGGFKIPIHLWESLYQYQKVGVKWLWELHQQRCGGILGDEMGLGKTIQVINFFIGISCSNMLFRMSQYRGLGPVLLITPATVMHQWVQEFHTWWPPFRVAILHESGSFSGTKAGLIRSMNEGRGFLITSYSGLVNNQNEILQYDWHYVVLDEGHKIRNPDAQITLVVKQVKTPHRLILSGSPLQNNLKELWSLFDFVYPGKLGTLPTFIEEFSVPITQGGFANATQVQVAIAYKCAKALRDLINPYLLRRMKSDVKDHINLPEKSEQVLFCKMTDDQRSLYKDYVASKEIESILKGNFNLFVGLINLRKICNHPHLFDGGPKIIKANPHYIKRLPKTKSSLCDASSNIANADIEDDEGEDIDVNPSDAFGHWSKSGKMVVLETLLKLWHAQGHKVLLFTQSRQMLCILEKFIMQCKYNYLRLDGSTSIGSRQPMITKFNTDPSIFIFILTTRVGGLGVNLTAANRVILYDPDWNPSTDMQARERAWRIGQLREVTIYRLITSFTIEEKIYHRQVFKQFLTNRVLKDPKQKRFFKSNDMLELFTFNEGTKGTESQAIFAGTGSNIKIKNPKKATKQPREKPSGKLRDVPNLVKQRPAKQQSTTAITNDELESNNPKFSATRDSQTNAEQNEYVLQKLFSKSGVHAALRHDKIVDTNESDYMIVEKEAEAVAKKAIETLKRSRQQCWDAQSGHVNYTGQQGEIRVQTLQPKLRFGKKKSEKPSTSTSSTEKALLESTSRLKKGQEKLEEPLLLAPDKYFSGRSLLQEALTNKEISTSKNAVMSSADLLSIIRARRTSLPIPEQPEPGTSRTVVATGSDSYSGPELKPEQIELLGDIREFIAFQATVDGQATTDELVEKFGPRLPNGQSPLFKQMLSQLCTFRKVEGRGVWRLKPDFR